MGVEGLSLEPTRAKPLDETGRQPYRPSGHHARSHDSTASVSLPPRLDLPVRTYRSVQADTEIVPCYRGWPLLPRENFKLTTTRTPARQVGHRIMTKLKPETRDKLKSVSTATLCTALFKRGLRNQFIQDVHPLNPDAGPMVGEAFTLRYIPAREDLNPISVFQDRAHPQRKAVEDCPPGAVLVIDSRKDPRAASAGSHPGHAPDEARRRRRRHRRRLPRLARDRQARHPRLSQPPLGADQPHAAPGDRHQRADRLRRRAGVSRRRDRRRRRGRGGDPRASRRRDRRGGRRDDRVRGFRHREGAEGPLDPRPLPATDAQTNVDFAAWRKTKNR